MKSPVSKFVLVMMVAVFLGGCATSYQPVPGFTPAGVDAQGYALKTNQMVVVLDSSSSMAEAHGPYRKFDVATATVKNLFNTIPEGLAIQGGLRTFGHHQDISRKNTMLIAGMGTYDRATFLNALQTVTKPGGTSNLAAALNGAVQDLDGLAGKSAIILVTDGKDMGKGPLASIAAAKEKLGAALCIYPILVGDDETGKKLADQLTQTVGCGSVYGADSLAGGQQMADLVKKIFIGERLVVDSDGDGVPDHLDKCPGTPAGVKVDAVGCPLDSDGDGVPDYLDKCPGTPAGVKVDATGCPKTILDQSVTSWSFDNIYFAIDKADITPASFGVLNDIVDAFKQTPHLKVVVEGHTDITGSHAHNMKLSQRRAQAVVDYLVAKGIAPSRLTTAGFGPDRPVADNKTVEGRAKNRRVQFTKVD